MVRAPCCEKVGLKRGRWTSEEDEILRKYIEANGEGSWRSLPKNAGLLRCGKSCRLRWINYLRSDLKRGNISSEEEEIIINLHASLGNRWSLIAGHLAGRTDNEIKNYWNSHLSRKIHSFRRPNPQFIPPAVVAKRRSTRKSKKSDGKSNPKGWEERGVVMPTTPVPEKESLPSTTVINGSDVIPDSSPLQEGMESLVATGTDERESWDDLMLPINEGTQMGMGMGMENLDDIMEDLSGIWGLEKEVIMDEESGPGNGNCCTGNNSRDEESGPGNEKCCNDSRDEESGPGNGNCSSELQKLGEWDLMTSPGDFREWHWGEEENTFSWFWDAER